MTPLADKIPTMSDTDLSSLRANAARLVEHGSSNEAVAAGDIIPLIDIEAARRAAAPKVVVKKARAPARKKAVPVTGHQTALPSKVA